MRTIPKAVAGLLFGLLLSVAPALGDLKITELFPTGASTAPAISAPVNVRNVKPGSAAVQIWCVGLPCTATGLFIVEIRSYDGAPWKIVASYTSLTVDADVPDGGEGGEYDTLPVTGDVRVRIPTLNSGTVRGVVVIND